MVLQVPIRLISSFHWHKIESHILGLGVYTGTELLFWCQQKLVINLTGHPVCGFIDCIWNLLLRIIKPKEYRAKLSYLLHPVDPDSGRPVPGETLPEVRLPALSSTVPDSWTTIEDEFRIAFALNLSHLDPATMFAPQRDRHCFQNSD